ISLEYATFKIWKWTFSVPIKGSKDEYIRLVYAADTDIRRHTKVISEANPFDEKWQDYFVEREERRMRNNLKGRKKLIKIWNEQKGCCAVCQSRITVETNFRIRKIGKSNYLVHPYCLKTSWKN
ncbi:MAG: hypothetical protein ACI4SR_10320, partial [Faecalibacillus sp.]